MSNITFYNLSSWKNYSIVAQNGPNIVNIRPFEAVNFSVNEIVAGVTYDVVENFRQSTYATQVEMEAGTETEVRFMSPENIKQAIDALAAPADIVQIETVSNDSVTINTDDDYHEIDLDPATGDVTIVVDSSDTTFTEGHQTLAKVIQGTNAVNVNFTGGTNIISVDSSVGDLSALTPAKGDYAVLKFMQFRNRLCVVSADYFLGPVTAPELDLFIMAGQSNINGQADATLLGSAAAPNAGQLTNMDSMYYASWHDQLFNAESTQHYSEVSSTTSLGYTSPTQFEDTLIQKDKFGPEIGFIHQALANSIVSNQLAVMKYAVDGSALTDALGATQSISDWDTQNSGTNIGDCWAGFKLAIADAVAKFEAIGYTVNIKGMFWWQGTNGTSAADLTTFISEVRNHLGTVHNVPNSSEFPVVITEAPYWGANLVSVSNADNYVGYIDSTVYGQAGTNVHVGSGETASTDTTANNINDMLDIGFAYADEMAPLVTIAGDWTPAELAGQGAWWWDASDAAMITSDPVTDEVTVWTDKNQSVDIVKDGVADAPRTNLAVRNGLNVLDFNGTQRMIVPYQNRSRLTAYTKIIVFAIETQSANQNNLLAGVTTEAIAGGNTPGSDALNQANNFSYRLFQDSVQPNGSTIVQTGDYHIIEATADATGSDLYFNGELETMSFASGPVDGSGVSLNGNMEIGSFYGGNYLNGQIAEMVLIPSVASVSDRQKVEGYLAHKWDIADKLDASHPYKSNAPTL